MDTIIVLTTNQFCVGAVNDTTMVMTNDSITVSPLDNDAIYVDFPPEDSCLLNVTVFPSNGVATPLPDCNGFMYVANPGFMGQDTLVYEVCISTFCAQGNVLFFVGEAIPTMGEWALILLTGLMLAFGARKLV